MECMAMPGKAGETVKVLMAMPEPEDWTSKCLNGFIINLWDDRHMHLSASHTALSLTAIVVFIISLYHYPNPLYPRQDTYYFRYIEFSQTDFEKLHF